MTTTTSGDTFEILSLDHRHLLHGDGFAGRVNVGAHTLYVSRYDTEHEWIVDGLWRTANSFPIFHNGDGSRCTMLRAVADPFVVAALDAAASAVTV